MPKKLEISLLLVPGQYAQYAQDFHNPFGISLSLINSLLTPIKNMSNAQGIDQEYIRDTIGPPKGDKSEGGSKIEYIKT